MSVEQPKQPIETSAGHAERAPDAHVNPAEEAEKRIAYAEHVAGINHNKLNSGRIFLNSAKTEKPTPRISMEDLVDRTRANTMAVINGRIARAQAMLDSDKKAAKKITWGQRFDSTFKLGGLLGQTSLGAEAEGIKLQEKALASLQDLGDRVEKMSTLREIQTCRTTQLGLAALPQELVADYDKYQAMVAEGIAAKDPSSGLDVDWQKINQQLQQAEVVLDRWETAIQIADTGMGIAAGLVPGGSEVYEIAHALTDVAVGTKTPDQAARDFAFGVLASRVGGKALKKMNVDELATAWAKKNAKYFSKKTAESLSRVIGKTAAGATQGAISGAAEGSMHGAYDVGIAGTKTLNEAAANTVYRAGVGAAFGGVLSGAGEGWKMRGEYKAAKQKIQLRDGIMQLPETPEGRDKRVQKATEILNSKRVRKGREATDMTQEKHAAILKAHDVPMRGVDANGKPMYSTSDLKQKRNILKAAGFQKWERRVLMEYGVCGALPPPPKKNPNILPPVPNTLSSRSTPLPPAPKPKINPAATPAAKQATTVPKGPPPPIPIIKKSPLAPPTPPSAKNTITQKTALPNAANTARIQEINRMVREKNEAAQKIEDSWMYQLGFGSTKRVTDLRNEIKTLNQEKYRLLQQQSSAANTTPQKTPDKPTSTPTLNTLPKNGRAGDLIVPKGKVWSWDALQTKAGMKGEKMDPEVQALAEKIPASNGVIVRTRIETDSVREGIPSLIEYDVNANNLTPQFQTEYMTFGDTAGRAYMAKEKGYNPVNGLDYRVTVSDERARTFLANKTGTQNATAETVIKNDHFGPCLIYVLKDPHYTDASSSKRGDASFNIIVRFNTDADAQAMLNALQNHPTSVRSFFWQQMNRADLECRDYLFNNRLPQFDKMEPHTTYFLTQESRSQTVKEANMRI